MEQPDIALGVDGRGAVVVYQLEDPGKGGVFVDVVPPSGTVFFEPIVHQFLAVAVG